MLCSNQLANNCTKFRCGVSKFHNSHGHNIAIESGKRLAPTIMKESRDVLLQVPFFFKAPWLNSTVWTCGDIGWNHGRHWKNPRPVSSAPDSQILKGLGHALRMLHALDCSTRPVDVFVVENRQGLVGMMLSWKWENSKRSPEMVMLILVLLEILQNTLIAIPCYS